MALLEQLEHRRMRELFIILLKTLDNINFYYPTQFYNGLVILSNLKRNRSEYRDLMDVLLERKEIQIPVVIDFLVDCFESEYHMCKILEIFDRQHVNIPHTFSELITHAVINRNKFSPRIFKGLVDRCDLNFTQMVNLLFVYNSKFVTYLPLIDWKNLVDYDEGRFCELITNLFTHEHVSLMDAHDLLHVFQTIVQAHKISIRIPHPQMTEILRESRPEQIILLNAVHPLFYVNYNKNNTTNIPDSAALMFVKKHNMRKFGAFIQYWKHKTYCPESKIFFEKLKEYTHHELMQKK